MFIFFAAGLFLMLLPRQPPIFQHARFFFTLTPRHQNTILRHRVDAGVFIFDAAATRYFAREDMAERKSHRRFSRLISPQQIQSLFLLTPAAPARLLVAGYGIAARFLSLMPRCRARRLMIACRSVMPIDVE